MLTEPSRCRLRVSPRGQHAVAAFLGHAQDGFSGVHALDCPLRDPVGGNAVLFEHAPCGGQGLGGHGRGGVGHDVQQVDAVFRFVLEHEPDVVGAAQAGRGAVRAEQYLGVRFFVAAAYPQGDVHGRGEDMFADALVDELLQARQAAAAEGDGVVHAGDALLDDVVGRAELLEGDLLVNVVLGEPLHDQDFLGLVQGGLGQVARLRFPPGQVAVILQYFGLGQAGLGVGGDIEQGYVQVLETAEETRRETNCEEGAVVVADGQQDVSVHGQASRGGVSAHGVVQTGRACNAAGPVCPDVTGLPCSHPGLFHRSRRRP